jgi:hypothetical protein
LTFVFTLFLTCAVAAPSQILRPLDDADRKRLVDAAARLLEERFVFPEVGKKCDEHIRAKFEAGAFDGLDDREAFPRNLTEELQSVSHDRHMRVRVQPMVGHAGPPVDPSIERHRMQHKAASENFGSLALK